jgi:hypothetical protein
MLHTDHTDEISLRHLPLPVASTDQCSFFEQRRNTIFNGHDCWHCKYGEFGIDTDTPTEEGYCKYQIVKMNRFTVL